MATQSLTESVCRAAVEAVNEYGTAAAAAAALNIPDSTFRSRIKAAKRRFGYEQACKPTQRYAQSTEERTDLDLGDNAGTVVMHRRANYHSKEEVLAGAGLDAKDWRVVRVKAGTYEGQSKAKDGTITVVQMWKIEVQVVPVAPLDMEAQRQGFIQEMQAYAPRMPKLAKPKKSKDGVLLELSLPDLHVGKLAWGEEVGENYDVKIAERVFRDAASDLVNRARAAHNIERILFVVGNDMLHVDNLNNTTTRGTPQDVDSRWPKAFKVCRSMLTSVVADVLRPVAPVDIEIVPGNHDKERTFYLGDSLESFFHKDSRVVVDNAPATRKYYTYGSVLLGLDHGDMLKDKDLPLLMAREKPRLWAAATHREWHLGHFHKMKHVMAVVGDTHGGIPIRYLPSLSGTDNWHFSMGYVKGVRAAEAYLWSKTGPVGTLLHMPDANAYAA